MIHTSRIKDNWTPKFLAVEQFITFAKVGIEQKLLRKRKKSTAYKISKEIRKLSIFKVTNVVTNAILNLPICTLSKTRR